MFLYLVDFLLFGHNVIKLCVYLQYGYVASQMSFKESMVSFIKLPIGLYLLQFFKPKMVFKEMETILRKIKIPEII